MRSVLERQLSETLRLEPGARFLFLGGFIRCVLQTAAVAAVEYVLSQIDEAAEEAVDGAKKVLHPLDGDMVGALDALLPLIRSEDWPACCTAWFTGGKGSLSARAQAWIVTRNDAAHGVPSQAFVERELPVAEALARDLVLGLSDLVPDLSQGAPILKAPGLSLELQCVLVDGRRPVVLRDLRCRGGAWQARYHALDPLDAREGTRRLDGDLTLLAATGRSSQEFVSHRVVRPDGGRWTPTVRLPGKNTSVFQGRTAELSALLDWWNDLESRVCLVYGDGGVGKTTLVLEFLNDLLENSRRGGRRLLVLERRAGAGE